MCSSDLANRGRGGRRYRRTGRRGGRLARCRLLFERRDQHLASQESRRRKARTSLEPIDLNVLRDQPSSDKDRTTDSPDRRRLTVSCAFRRLGPKHHRHLESSRHCARDDRKRPGLARGPALVVVQALRPADPGEQSERLRLDLERDVELLDRKSVV